ncbi:mCG140680, partial [Mus musculus]
DKTTEVAQNCSMFTSHQAGILNELVAHPGPPEPMAPHRRTFLDLQLLSFPMCIFPTEVPLENDMQWDRREKTWCLRKCEAMRAAPRLERASHITTARQSPLSHSPSKTCSVQITPRTDRNERKAFLLLGV